jgi:enoyl-CoA hydratase/carnithine racemase
VPDILGVKNAGASDEVALNRSDRLNAINQPLADALLCYFTGQQRDTDRGAIVISGANQGFCSGADLKACG